MNGYKLYFGCTHTQFHPKKHLQFQNGYPEDTEGWEEFVERAFRYADGYLDFFPIIYYPAYTYYAAGDFVVESVGPKNEFDEEWEKVKRLSRKHNNPGKLVTFPGYEWTGDRRRWGDHNVIFFDEEEAVLDLSTEVGDLFENLRKRKAIAIPHHTGYKVGYRGKDWDHHDPELSPVAEIFSVHGSSEAIDAGLDLRANAAMSPRVSGGTIVDGLNRGNRFGIIASGDNASGFPGRWGLGLAAVWAKDLSRESIWDAISKRRTYGITGDRIRLEFATNDHPMGSELSTDGEVSFRGSVVGSDAIDRIELIRNGRIINTLCRRGAWELDPTQEMTVKLRIELGWGPPPGKGVHIERKKWNGSLSVSDGEIVDVEKCFTRGGQRVDEAGDAVTWNLTTGMNVRPFPESTSQQALVFTIRGTDGTLVEIESESVSYTARLPEVCEGSVVIPHPEAARKVVAERFGLTEYENRLQKEYTNSYKTLIHRGVPESGYTAAYAFDDSPPSGESYYYLRVSQDNGQMAWSSPIWITRKM